MIPKHTNPFSLTSETALVSRSALNESDEEPEIEHEDPEHAQLLARLENILKRTIDNVLLPAPRSTETEEPSKKKRRRKGGDGDVHGATNGVPEDKEDSFAAVEFRLISGSSRPRTVILAPKPPPVYISLAPPVEETAEEAELRASRAREVAVDFEWVQRESKNVTRPPPPGAKKPLRAAAKLPELHPTLLVLERPKPPRTPHIQLVNPADEIDPSPHAHQTVCCPVVATQPSQSDATGKRRRRRGKAKERPRIQPAFWRPPPGVGGKALGYAWGYAGSNPLQEGDVPRYERDAMRKAELA
ncbi:uncharacterized protein BXZ73DRAFT_96201 [Epithele typhae]|uniref:uncharacterized protein n=1 Tax=Epithele typhae TaxID=378194 RepID=UPI0020075399|nr:uncharacterized protein BXZ73DRAFT_96201 [Epithele typhae]KAH9945211.1 hypothetical protein BXZ73DRAFT_96201 [Epithele typhae]